MNTLSYSDFQANTNNHEIKNYYSHPIMQSEIAYSI